MIAYKQPVTVPEIQEIRGVQASGVIKTLLDKKLVAAGGRKEVLGRPILYKTTKEFPDSLRPERYRRASEHGRIRGTHPEPGLFRRVHSETNSPSKKSNEAYTPHAGTTSEDPCPCRHRIAPQGRGDDSQAASV